MSKSGLLFLPILIGFLGCVWMVIGARELVRAFKTMSWPKAPGVITQSRVISYIVSGEQGSAKQSVQADIEYSFSVGGRSFTGSDVRFGDPLVNPLVSNRGAANEVTQQYGRRMSVTVAFDRADPGRAVLEPGMHAGSWLGLLAGLAWAGFAAWLQWRYRQAGEHPIADSPNWAAILDRGGLAMHVFHLSSCLLILLLLFSSTVFALQFFRGQLYFWRWGVIEAVALPVLLLVVKGSIWLVRKG